MAASDRNKQKETSFIPFFEMLDCHELGTWTLSREVNTIKGELPANVSRRLGGIKTFWVFLFSENHDDKGTELSHGQTLEERPYQESQRESVTTGELLQGALWLVSSQSPGLGCSSSTLGGLGLGTGGWL